MVRKRARFLLLRERRYIDECLKSGSADPEHLMGVTSHLLSELSRQASIVLIPALGETVLKTAYSCEEPNSSQCPATSSLTPWLVFTGGINRQTQFSLQE